MNKLELFKALWKEQDLSNTTPSTTLSQSGELLQSVGWLDTAYASILRERYDWQFMVADYEFSITEGKSEYTATEAGIDDLSKWVVSDMTVYSDGYDDEQGLTFCQWKPFKSTYLRGTSRTTTGRPQIVSVKPDNSLIFSAIPDRDYTCTGEYRRRIVELADDDAVPVFPEDFHMIIVWRALMFHGSLHAETDKYAHGLREYTKLFAEMCNSQLPMITRGSAPV